jgi:hypothetical protein
MKRREFIAGLAGAAAWPGIAEAQQAERVRRIGVLMGFGENDPDAKGWLSGFMQALAELGWTDGRNPVKQGDVGIATVRSSDAQLPAIGSVLMVAPPAMARFDGRTSEVPTVPNGAAEDLQCQASPSPDKRSVGSAPLWVRNENGRVWVASHRTRVQVLRVGTVQMRSSPSMP